MRGCCPRADARGSPCHIGGSPGSMGRRRRGCRDESQPTCFRPCRPRPSLRCASFRDVPPDVVTPWLRSRCSLQPRPSDSTTIDRMPTRLRREGMAPPGPPVCTVRWRAGSVSSRVKTVMRGGYPRADGARHVTLRARQGRWGDIVAGAGTSPSLPDARRRVACSFRPACFPFRGFARVARSSHGHPSWHSRRAGSVSSRVITVMRARYPRAARAWNVAVPGRCQYTSGRQLLERV